MENINGEVKKSSKAKIIVPVIIILIVAGIWFIKDSNKVPIGDINGDDSELITENADFALNATEDFDIDNLKSYGMPMMLDFGSPTCPPCKAMAPELRRVHKNMHKRAIIKYIDVSELSDLTSDYPVKVVPTQFFFDKDGNPYKPQDPEKWGMLIYTTKDTGEHVLTAHEGALTEEQMTEILEEMGLAE